MSYVSASGGAGFFAGDNLTTTSVTAAASETTPTMKSAMPSRPRTVSIPAVG